MECRLRNRASVCVERAQQSCASYSECPRSVQRSACRTSDSFPALSPSGNRCCGKIGHRRNERKARGGRGWWLCNSKPFQAAAQRWTQQLRVAFSRAPKRASTEIEMLLLSSTGDHVMLARFILIRSALQFCTWYRLPSRHVGRGVCTRGLVLTGVCSVYMSFSRKVNGIRVV